MQSPSCTDACASVQLWGMGHYSQPTRRMYMCALPFCPLHPRYKRENVK